MLTFPQEEKADGVKIGARLKVFAEADANGGKCDILNPVFRADLLSSVKVITARHNAMETGMRGCLRRGRQESEAAEKLLFFFVSRWNDLPL